MPERNNIHIQLSIDVKEASRALESVNRQLKALGTGANLADQQLIKMAQSMDTLGRNLLDTANGINAVLKLTSQMTAAMRERLDISNALIRADQAKTIALNEEAAAIQRNLAGMALFIQMLSVLIADMMRAQGIVRQTTVHFEQMANARLTAAQRFLAASQMEMAAFGADAGAAGSFTARMREAKAAVESFTAADLSKTAALNEEITALVRTNNITVTFVGMLKTLDAGARQAAASMRLLNTEAGSLEARFARSQPRQIAGPAKQIAQSAGSESLVRAGGALARSTIIEMGAVKNEAKAMGGLSGSINNATRAITGMTTADEKKTRALRQETTEMEKGSRGAQKFSNSIKGTASGLGAMAGALAALGVVEFSKNILQSAAKIDALEKSLTAVVKPGTDVQALFTELRELSERPGLDLEATLVGFVQIMPSFASSVAISKEVVEEFSNAIALAGKGPAEFQLVMTQLGQMVSKGKIMQEDLKLILQQSPFIRKAIEDAFGTIDPEVLRDKAGSMENFMLRVLESMNKMQRAPTSLATMFTQLSNSLVILSAEFGKTLAATIPFDFLIQQIRDFTEVWKNADPMVKEFVAGLFAIGAAMIVVAGAARTLWFALGPILANPAALGLIAALAGAYAALKTIKGSYDEAKAQRELTKITDQAVASQQKLADSLKSTGKLAGPVEYGEFKVKYANQAILDQAKAVEQLTQMQKDGILTAAEYQKQLNRLGQQAGAKKPVAPIPEPEKPQYVKDFEALLAANTKAQTEAERKAAEKAAKAAAKALQREAEARAREIQKAEQAADKDLAAALAERQKVYAEMVGGKQQMLSDVAELSIQYAEKVRDLRESVQRAGGERVVNLRFDTLFKLQQAFNTRVHTAELKRKQEQADLETEMAKERLKIWEEAEQERIKIIQAADEEILKLHEAAVKDLVRVEADARRQALEDSFRMQDALFDLWVARTEDIEDLHGKRRLRREMELIDARARLDKDQIDERLRHDLEAIELEGDRRKEAAEQANRARALYQIPEGVLSATELQRAADVLAVVDDEYRSIAGSVSEVAIAEDSLTQARKDAATAAATREKEIIDVRKVEAEVRAVKGYLRELFNDIRQGMAEAWDIIFSDAQNKMQALGQLIKRIIMNFIRDVVTSALTKLLMRILGLDKTNMGNIQAVAAKDMIVASGVQLTAARLMDAAANKMLQAAQMMAAAAMAAANAAAASAAGAGGGGGGAGGGGGSNIFEQFTGMLDVMGKVGGATGGTGSGQELIKYGLPTGSTGGGGKGIGGIFENLKGLAGLDNLAGLSTASKITKVATSDLAAMAGVLLVMGGLKRGGKAGTAMTIGGGALIGAKIGLLFGNPLLGAAIGAGVGAFASWIRSMRKSGEEKAREAIQRYYGVDVTDKQMLTMVAAIAKDSYGGNMNMAVVSPEVRELVQLYSLSTGQTPRGMPPVPPSGMYSSTGSGLQMQPTYSNGYVVPNPYMTPVNAQRSGGGNVYVQLDPRQAEALMQGRVIQVVHENPEVVAAANRTALSQGTYRNSTRAAATEPLRIAY